MLISSKIHNGEQLSLLNEIITKLPLLSDGLITVQKRINFPNRCDFSLKQ
mgnify:CR=1 FL=1